MMIFTPSAALISTGEDQNELTSVGPGASRGDSGRIDDACFLNELSFVVFCELLVLRNRLLIQTRARRRTAIGARRGGRPRLLAAALFFIFVFCRRGGWLHPLEAAPVLISGLTRCGVSTSVCVFTQRSNRRARSTDAKRRGETRGETSHPRSHQRQSRHPCRPRSTMFNDVHAATPVDRSSSSSSSSSSV